MHGLWGWDDSIDKYQLRLEAEDSKNWSIVSTIVDRSPRTASHNVGHAALQAFMTERWIARCNCGGVEFRATGAPIATVACYCDDCQAGGGQIESLANAVRALDADGGTGYLAFRKDRVQCIKGDQFLRAYKLREQSTTNRVVATCCHSAMILNFDDGKHWVDVYRNRVQGNVPPIQMHICTKYRVVSPSGPSTVPEFPTYPISFLMKLVGAKLAMLLGR